MNHTGSVRVIGICLALVVVFSMPAVSQVSRIDQHSLRNNFSPAAPAPTSTQTGRALPPSSGPGLFDFGFLPAVTSTPSMNPGSMVVADLNNDGFPDVVLWDPYSPQGIQPTIGIMLGNGDGTLQPEISFPIDTAPFYVFVADVNNDGKPDLVTMYPGNSSTLVVFLGNGDGTFQPVIKSVLDWAVEGGVRSALDLNGDGKIDLLVTMSPTDGSGNNLAVLFGNGDGTFTVGSPFSSKGPSWTSVAVADLNRDGVPDIMVVNAFYYPHSYSVLLGRGDGTFQEATVYPLEPAPGAVVLADVNRDGTPDLVGTATSSIELMFGNGDGTFQSPVSYSSGGYYTTVVSVADVNGDGVPDLVTANCGISDNSGCSIFYPGMVGVLLGNGDGTFQWPLTFSSSGNDFTLMAVADMNADGRPDVVTGGIGSTASIGVLRNIPLTATSVTLTTSPNPALFTQWITFTATVTSAKGTIPDGETVTFKSGPQVISAGILSGGVATGGAYASKLPSLSPVLTASYSGDSTFAPSISTAVKQTVDLKWPTTTTLTSSLNPSTYGQRLTLTATVSNGGNSVPAGRITFTWGIYTIGSANLNSSGVATLPTAKLNADIFPLTAVYRGDSTNQSSTSAVMNQVVNPATSSATLTSSPNPSNVGQSVTFTAKITSPTTKPSGPVTFTAGKTTLGAVNLTNGKATLTTSSLPTGTNTVTVTFAGDSDIRGSSASVTQVVH